MASALAPRSGWAIPFFFQAEDGIRDPLVTGVQTCALPISRPPPGRPVRPRTTDRRRRHGDGVAGQGRGAGEAGGREIGRASCRERVERWVVGVALKERTRARTGGGTEEDQRWH